MAPTRTGTVLKKPSKNKPLSAAMTKQEWASSNDGPSGDAQSPNPKGPMKANSDEFHVPRALQDSTKHGTLGHGQIRVYGDWARALKKSG